MNVLIVDDDPLICHLMQRIVEEQGLSVTVCDTAEAALQAFESEPSPLILLDWILPGMSGLELCRKIRQSPLGEWTFIILVTGQDKPEDLRAALDAGADDYYAKPIQPSHLSLRIEIARRQVQTLLQRKRAEASLAESMQRLEESRDDLLSVFELLSLGTLITEADGQVTFLNKAGSRLLGMSAKKARNQHWTSCLPVLEEQKEPLEALYASPSNKGKRLPVTLQLESHQRFLEVDIRHAPNSPERRIFVLYDRTELYALRRLLDDKAQFGDLIGRSEPMQQVYQFVQELARVESTVLIRGETGTGKELVARALHYSSPRKERPFIPVNTAGLTDSLLASQLFGHRKGAYTGAVDDHKGFFEEANGGTIFLDEIGDIPQSVQVQLLRVLQQKEILRLGESLPRSIDVRIIAATHQDLKLKIQQGKFREDLYYRLNVARLELPALRNRKADIPLLAKTFLEQMRAFIGKEITGIQDDAMRLFFDYDWPGNVRELRNAIEFATIRCRNSTIGLEDLPPELLEGKSKDKLAGAKYPVANPKAQLEQQQLLMVLEQAGGNRSRAARILHMSRATFYRRLKEHGIPSKH